MGLRRWATGKREGKSFSLRISIFHFTGVALAHLGPVAGWCLAWPGQQGTSL